MIDAMWLSGISTDAVCAGGHAEMRLVKISTSGAVMLTGVGIANVVVDLAASIAIDAENDTTELRLSSPVKLLA